MGQKINPNGFRVGVIKDWNSRWMVDDKFLADTIIEDHSLREMLKKRLYAAGVPKIEIERTSNKVTINIFCARPGVVIGKGGTEIEKIRKNCEKIVNKNRDEKLAVYINVVEVKQIDKNATLVAENIAQQLENRVAFRRAMKQAMGRAMRFGAKGIKVQVGGRLGGAEIARVEHYHEGTIPLQTLRADIDYGVARASTTYGIIGVKVWIYEGEVLGDAAPTIDRERDQRRKPPRRRPDNFKKSEGGAK